MNESGAEEIRTRYYLGVYNQRGAHIIDSEGKMERALAPKYNMAAEEAEKLGLGIGLVPAVLRDP